MKGFFIGVYLLWNKASESLNIRQIISKKVRQLLILVDNIS